MSTGGPGPSDQKETGDSTSAFVSKPTAAPGGVAGSDVDLVVRMRTGAPATFEAFVDRFHPVLLDYARRAGVDRSERDELVSDVLSDAALHFLGPGMKAPGNPRMYLIRAFRNRLLDRRRGHARRERYHAAAARDAALDTDHADNTVAVAGCSESAVRESRGPGWERVALPRALALLAIHLDEALTAEERQLLVAVADNVPQREVGKWLGVSHAAARKKLERLRGRMIQVAIRYTNSLGPDDAREVQRFFQRCRARVGALERSDKPPNGGASSPVRIEDGQPNESDTDGEAP